ncbi:Arm DNA-binding domain-containing protein [Halalkalibacter hemicellulosilyticus]|uniref:Arm DNA-binding domain-containing protein n=1 Tax=Halalkalibacter hemicellulosilyticus TaxID=127886 RepID=UPI0034E2E2E6
MCLIPRLSEKGVTSSNIQSLRLFYKRTDNLSKVTSFIAYLSKDPLTGKKKRTTRQGFKTKKEAKVALSKLLVEVDELGLRQNEQMTFQ